MNKKIWIAPFVKKEKDIDGNIISIYDKPYCIYATINTLSGSAEIDVFGDRIKRMCKTMVPYRMINKIKENDVAYLFDTSPEGEEIYGENANYRVDAVLPQNIKAKVYFEKMIDDCKK